MQLFALENRLALLYELSGNPVYDFDFRMFFAGSSQVSDLPGVARVGAFEDYASFYQDCLEWGVRLVNSPEEQRRASWLPEWYPRLEGRTPRSRWFDELPSVTAIEAEFDYPIFVKGARQTSRHGGHSIVHSRDALAEALTDYAADPILHWQKLVVREFVPLRSVGAGLPGKLPPSFEFRTFWWQGKLVGAGPYWGAFDYRWTEAERAEAVRLGEWAALKVGTPFLVVDLAMTAQGEWIVIEGNDAMESGYAGVSPLGLWQSMVEAIGRANGC